MYYVSEIFHSLQGEGKYTGTPGPWVRFFGCNLSCQGFGQEDPTDPTSYKQPHLDWNLDDYESFSDLPMFEYGCDSAYSVNKKFRALCPQLGAVGIAVKIINSMKNEHNPEGLFRHPSGTDQHMHFTGGEPLLKKNQKAIAEVLHAFNCIENAPKYITIETNGTRALSDDFIEYFNQPGNHLRELFFSVSPKLYTVSGEYSTKAFKPDVVKSFDFNTKVKGQLKFVVNGTDACWSELENMIKYFRLAGVTWPIYLMPVGATVEQQSDIGDLASEIVARGYRLAIRAHCYIWGNAIGT